MIHLQTLKFSQHARVRMQQRGVPRRAVELIIEHGRCNHVRDGALSYSCTRRQLRHLQNELPASEFRGLEKPLLNTYVILNQDGKILTVAKRLGRLNS
jgi:hypothetical protein